MTSQFHGETPNPLSGPEKPSSAPPQNYKEVFQSRETVSKFADPCRQAARESMACMDRNNYDRDQCLDFFRSYRECKNEWIKQRKEDRRNRR